MQGPPEAAVADSLAALYDLSVRYAAAVDVRDGDGFARLFEPDGELVVPDYPNDLRPVVTRSGPVALRRVPEGLRPYYLTFHQVSNPQFRIEGDEATGTVQCVAHHLSGPPPEAVDTVWFIRYEDTYRRRDRTWRFRRRALHLQWVEHHPVSRLGPSDPSAEPG